MDLSIREIPEDIWICILFQINNAKDFLNALQVRKISLQKYLILIPIKRREFLREVQEEIKFGGKKVYRVLPNRIKEGEYKIYHKNNNIKYMCNFVNGLKEGPCTRYHESGKLHMISNMIHGEEEGIRQTFELEGFYDIDFLHNGVLHGFCQTFYPNDRPKCQATYINGRLNGLYKEFYKNGVPSEIVNYVDDKMEGLCREFYKNGNVRSFTLFSSGKIRGKVHWFDLTNRISEWIDPPET